MRTFWILLSFLSLLCSLEALSSRNNPSIREAGTTKNVATQILQGVGPVTNDQLNAFNLQDVEDIKSQWTALRVQKATENTSSVRLGCQSPDVSVDFVAVQFRRTGNALGLQLEEIAGNSLDNLGITIVTESSRDDILIGDSIVKLTLIRSKKDDGLSTTEERFEVSTECLNFDATVQAIQSLPKYDEVYEETIDLSLKRLRRRPKVDVRVRYPNRSEEDQITLFAGQNLRQALLVRGIVLNDPAVQRFDGKAPGSNCGAGGLCRTCKVQVEVGKDLLNPQRTAEAQMLSNEPRARLSCKTIVGYGMKSGELVVKAFPEQWKSE